MSRSLAEIRNFMEKMGLPGRDGHALPDSPRTFPDGCHYRIEIAGVEGMASLSALVEEADKRKIPVHRAIATVGGSTYLELTELRDMAMLAREAGIEIILTVGHRKGWDAGAKEMATSEGMMNGFRLRGSDNLSYWLADMARGLEAGFRGFLVYDEGLLSILGQMRQEGFHPAGDHVQVFRLWRLLQRCRGQTGSFLGSAFLKPVVGCLPGHPGWVAPGCGDSAGCLYQRS